MSPFFFFSLSLFQATVFTQECREQRGWENGKRAGLNIDRYLEKTMQLSPLKQFKKKRRGKNLHGRSQALLWGSWLFYYGCRVWGVRHTILAKPGAAVGLRLFYYWRGGIRFRRRQASPWSVVSSAGQSMSCCLCAGCRLEPVTADVCSVRILFHEKKQQHSKQKKKGKYVPVGEFHY